MTRAVCSGSFDPVTNGHINIFERASKMFDELIVVVFNNIRKQGFFPVEERVRLIREASRHIPNLRVDSWERDIPSYMRQVGASVNIRGLRSVTDFEYEVQQAQTLKYVAPEIDTVFMMTQQNYAFVSSSAIKEMSAFGLDCSELVPPCVAEALRRRSKS